MTDIRMDIVDLLLDCEEFSIEAITENRLRHNDGRPFTEQEAARAGEAGRAELEAVVRYYETAKNYHAAAASDLDALAALTEPYFIQLDLGATLADVRAIMTPQAAAQLDELLSRVAP
jgi:hypothetical protein